MRYKKCANTKLDISYSNQFLTNIIDNKKLNNLCENEPKIAIV